MKSYVLLVVLICLPFISFAENDKNRVDYPLSLNDGNPANADGQHSTFIANGIYSGDQEPQVRESNIK